MNASRFVIDSIRSLMDRSVAMVFNSLLISIVLSFPILYDLVTLSASSLLYVSAVVS